MIEDASGKGAVLERAFIAVVMVSVTAAVAAVTASWFWFDLWAAILTAGAALIGLGAGLMGSKSAPPVQTDALRRELDDISKRYRQLFDIVPCYITLQDRNLRIVDANTLFREDFGDQTGAKCFCAYKGRDDICTDCPVMKTFADGQIHSSEERVVTLQGREAAVMVHSMPVLDEEGNTQAVMEVSTNITEVKDLQRQLVMVGLAVAGMAHRIKNVMMGLEGGIFVVNTGFEEKDEATIKRGWSMVQRNGTKISRMARDLLFCSKEREPRLETDTSPAAIARDVHELFAPRVLAEGIELRLEVDETDDRGSYDPEALHSLMANLVANALDACRFDAQEKQHFIVLRCHKDDAGVVVEVQDNGPGISREDSDRVFDGFFSTKGTEGTGLGLLVVQKVAHEHGGSVSFDSKLGEGTTFSARLRSQVK